MKNGTGYPNRLGVWGWLGGGRWGVERYLYTLHRVTGLGLLAYFVMHILLTSTGSGWSWSSSASASANRSSRSTLTRHP